MPETPQKWNKNLLKPRVFILKAPNHKSTSLRPLLFWVDVIGWLFLLAPTEHQISSVVPGVLRYIPRACPMRLPSESVYSSDFLFPLQAQPPPHPDKPPGCPTTKSLILVHCGSVSVHFGSVWLRLGPFRVSFGSVSGPFWGVGWGRGEGLL